MTERKPLIESQLRILRGERGHAPEKIEAYRWRLFRAGYSVPGIADDVTPPAEKPSAVQSDGWTEAEAIAKTPCVHRGQAIGEHVCVVCKGKRTHTIFECAIHGACTVRAASGAKWNGKRPACCITCDNIQTEVSPPPPAPSDSQTPVPASAETDGPVPAVPE